MTGTETHTDRWGWVHEHDARWDADRERLFATVPDGVFPTASRRPGERLSSDWWRVEQDGRVVGYGWLDDVWGDAEILLAVDGGARGRGVGSFALARLEEEAAARGLNYVLNVVRDTHPERDAVTAWFRRHGFTATDDGRLRKQVGDRRRDVGQRQDGRPGVGRAQPPDADRRARYEAERDRAAARPRGTAASAGDAEPMGPGHEESGGYVDVDSHRY
ncbi:GNAT family N-acetyltransferase [Geodermatophilus chilensis]|uniref:GNAT family N-acetyltransferase n=1 Tax=Geodermatophilus chilensis TaxID=2035835 RepID=UPI0013000E88|nr:GNAT family N-acetyltransferase [Geodermatophilus chilensis]